MVEAEKYTHTNKTLQEATLNLTQLQRLQPLLKAILR